MASRLAVMAVPSSMPNQPARARRRRGTRRSPSLSRRGQMDLRHSSGDNDVSKVVRLRSPRFAFLRGLRSSRRESSDPHAYLGNQAGYAVSATRRGKLDRLIEQTQGLRGGAGVNA